MRNCLSGKTLRQQRVTQQLMNRNGVRTQFDGTLQRWNCVGSVVFLHVGIAEAQKNFRRSGIQFCSLAKFDQGMVDVVAVFRVDPRL